MTRVRSCMHVPSLLLGLGPTSTPATLLDSLSPCLDHKTIACRSRTPASSVQLLGLAPKT